MKTHEIARGGSLFTYSEGNGNYSFENGVFQLKDLAPALYMNGKKVPFGKWKIVKAAENSLSAKADGKSGSWDFKAAVDKDGKLVLGMTGHLKEACEDIAVYYFEDLCIPADHLATQGRGTGDSDLYPLTGKNVKKNDFHGATVITITKKGTQLTISSPLLGDHIESYTGSFPPRKHREPGNRPPHGASSL